MKVTNRFASLDVEESSKEDEECDPNHMFLINNKSIFQTTSTKSYLKHKKSKNRERGNSRLNPDCLTISETDDYNKQEQEDKWLKPRNTIRTKMENETLSLGYKMLHSKISLKQFETKNRFDCLRLIREGFRN